MKNINKMNEASGSDNGNVLFICKTGPCCKTILPRNSKTIQELIAQHVFMYFTNLNYFSREL